MLSGRGRLLSGAPYSFGISMAERLGRPNSFVVLAASALLFAAGCSGNDGEPRTGKIEPVADDRAFVPEGLSNTELEGHEGGLTLVAFTLEEGALGLAFYAAVKNEGSTPACEIVMTTEFYDRAVQLVTSVGSVVSSGRFYLIDDGSGVVISCLPPGQVGMTSFMDLAPEVVISELGHVKHAFPAFTVAGIVPLEAVSVSNLTPVRTAGGSAYRGVLTNGLAQILSEPKVTIFPVNRVGRPLGVATASAVRDLPGSATWMFETSSVDDLGVGYSAFASGSVVP
jgi:hypothetical protein